MKNLSNKKILITGATGFVGANLTRHLVDQNADVHILTRQQSDKWRLKDILNKVDEHQVGLEDYKQLKKIFSKIKPEIIFHCAIYGGYPFQKDEKEILETNIMGTKNLLAALSGINYTCFVNSGSSSEYGLKSEVMSEQDRLEPINTYGVSKAAATLFCQFIAKAKKRPIVTLRLFSPYGLYEEPTRLIPSVITACLNGKAPKLSSPKPVRDFVFIEDVVDAYIKAATSINKVKGEIFNIASSKSYSVGEIVFKIIELTGNKVKPEWESIPNSRLEPTTWRADILKAKEILGWQPKHNLELGLKKTIKWFEDNMGLYNAKC